MKIIITKEEYDTLISNIVNQITNKLVNELYMTMPSTIDKIKEMVLASVMEIIESEDII